MRFLSFSTKDWRDYEAGAPKLRMTDFTTFRFPRRDKPWQPGEEVQIVIKARSKDRLVLGTAKIITKNQRWVIKPEWAMGPCIRIALLLHPEWKYVNRATEPEARRDGFKTLEEMADAIADMHKVWAGPDDDHPVAKVGRNILEPMDRLTLVWTETNEAWRSAWQTAE